MLRKIIKINTEKCVGCGLCANACHEGAIGIVEGKAKLLRDDYCDGLGNCLPVCPTRAISFEEREADGYNKSAAPKRREQDALACACPGTEVKTLTAGGDACHEERASRPMTQLRQWPVQIKLAPLCAPYFENANLLIAADCSAYAYGNFHHEFMKNKITLIGCPKLDEGDYSEKLTELFRQNDLQSITVVRMEVPCCGGIEEAVKSALRSCGKLIQWKVITLSTDGVVSGNF